jgi:hypothetical protein
MAAIVRSLFFARRRLPIEAKIQLGGVHLVGRRIHTREQTTARRCANNIVLKYFILCVIVCVGQRACVRNVTTLVSKLNYSAVKQWPKVLTGVVAAALIFFNVSGLSIETKSPAARCTLMVK